METGIYVHIPFCDHKCIYCDFYSITTDKSKKRFLDCLISEMRWYSRNTPKAPRTFPSIFFGGGTPSLLDPETIGYIINEIKSLFRLAPDAEITLETNPGTVDAQKLKEFLRAGVNRLSVGIQSFHAHDLQFLTRIHDAETAKQTVRSAAEAGFGNISVDLIFNLPGQTPELWKQNLDEALSLPIQHLSAYSLILEKGTILNKMVLDGKVKIQDTDHDAALYELTMQHLTGNGFEQYEVSNFCRPGYRCTHNLLYWERKEYFGFGPSAHGFINGKRYHNMSGLNLYLNKIGETGHAVIGEEFPDHIQAAEEYLMLGLRSTGFSMKKLRNSYGMTFTEKQLNLIGMLGQEGLIRIQGDIVSLTQKGYQICDEIIPRLLPD